MEIFLDELEKRGYYHQLKTLIEDTYQINHQTKVTLVVHSMGGPISLFFLTGFHGVTQAWKDKYINAYISLSGNWAGSLTVLRSVVSSSPGIPDDKLFVSSLVNDFIVTVARTFESIPMFVPDSSVYHNTTLVSTPSKEYTANDYSDLFDRIGYSNGYQFFQRVQDINPGFPAPNVPTYCFYGVNVETPMKYIYERDFISGMSTVGLPLGKIEYAKTGDGLVNIESLEVCHRWSGMPSKYLFKYNTYDDITHLNMVKSSEVLGDIALVVEAPESKKSFLSILLDSTYLNVLLYWLYSLFDWVLLWVLA